MIWAGSIHNIVPVPSKDGHPLLVCLSLDSSNINLVMAQPGELSNLYDQEWCFRYSVDEDRPNPCPHAAYNIIIITCNRM